ncbi:DUF4349 domain-containing protein [Lysobacter cavernae]|uniref:DUF4349 domain-containing protein n=1 Tax=Lysobacter cavernae TaxID=1685901 RepID=A0ABV7RSW9_9GAMM
MRNPTVAVMALVVVAALTACGGGSPQQAMESAGSGAAAPVAHRPGAMLAYEHHAQVALPAERIVQRLQQVQAACNDNRFGACTVLDVSQQGGDHPSASLSVRVVPAGVDPLIALAGKDGEIGSRRTHAEDLAVVVRDNNLAQQRLQNERTQLLAFQQRRDLAVADMIALSQQLAQVEAQLQAAEQEGAQHRLRIDTQKLTIRFEPPRGQSGRSEIGQAVRDFGRTLSAGTAWTIRAAAFLIPVAAVLLIVVLVIRRLRRRRGGR